MSSFVALSQSEKEKYERLKVKHRALREQNSAIKEAKFLKAIEKRNRRYNRFVARMEEAFKKSDITISGLAKFMGVDRRSLKDFYQNKNRIKRIDYIYAYVHCLIFAQNFTRAKREMILSGNPLKNDAKEDELMALLELVTSMNLSPAERLVKAKEYIDVSLTNF